MFTKGKTQRLDPDAATGIPMRLSARTRPVSTVIKKLSNNINPEVKRQKS